MSSTNRSDARKTHAADYYKTPVPSILDFFMAFLNDNPEMDFISTGDILDPCAGGCIDTLEPMSYPEAMAKYTTFNENRLITMDIRKDSLAEITGDFLQYTPLSKFDCIITNPPFNLALDIIKKALSITRDGGLVIMLLRLNFFGSRERSAFFRENMPSFSYVHSKRMSFSDTGGTDSIEYMHAVWVKGQKPKFTKLRVI